MGFRIVHYIFSSEERRLTLAISYVGPRAQQRASRQLFSENVSFVSFLAHLFSGFSQVIQKAPVSAFPLVRWIATTERYSMLYFHHEFHLGFRGNGGGSEGAWPKNYAGTFWHWRSKRSGGRWKLPHAGIIHHGHRTSRRPILFDECKSGFRAGKKARRRSRDRNLRERFCKAAGRPDCSLYRLPFHFHAKKAPFVRWVSR